METEKKNDVKKLAKDFALGVAKLAIVFLSGLAGVLLGGSF